MENRSREMGRGWPLGLGSIYLRVRLVENFPIATTATATAMAAANAEPRSVYVNVPSSTFSSFSSSNLDTESTVSFFQDKSKTLGRLIGIRPRNNRRSEVYLMRNSIDGLEEAQRRRRSFQEHQNHHHQCSNDDDHDEHEIMDIQMCNGFCVPLCLLSKTNTTKHKFKELN